MEITVSLSTWKINLFVSIILQEIFVMYTIVSLKANRFLKR